MSRLRMPLLTSITVAATVGSLVAAAAMVSAPATETADADAVALTCPFGTISYAEYLHQEERMRATARDSASGFRELADELLAEADGIEGCVAVKHPERYAELMMRAADQGAARLAGMGAMNDAALAAGARERAAMTPGSVAGTAGNGFEYGQGPLDTTHFGTEGLGIPNSSGRVDDLEYDDFNDFLFAAAGNGGVWISPDLSETWFDITGDLPAVQVYSVAWTTASGGRLIAITGDGTFGGIAGTPGIGAYYADGIGDLDRNNLDQAQIHWVKSTGVPDGALGFKVAVDKANPTNIYVATSKGLFRSTNAGVSFSNTNLPTGDCAGVTNTSSLQGGRNECHFANVVTDVVVQEPGGTTNVTTPIIVAAVGWRGGNYLQPDGKTVQAPANGIYRSLDGGVTWAAAAMTNFTPLSKRGRTELGPAVGEAQDHNYLWAMVQDAEALNGIGCAVLDAPADCSPSGAPTGINTVLDGVYVSSDFGDTWTQIATAEDFQGPQTGSSLNGTAQALGYQPGVQTWYNQFVAPDPTQTQPVTGIPTRLMVGMEEVWENTDSYNSEGPPPTVPPIAPATQFRVVGRYFGGDTCLFLSVGAPVCPTNTQDPVAGATTTHPDQHSAILIPTDVGVRLIVGNDGGVFQQVKPSSEDFDNTSWGDGKNTGFYNLIPYAAHVARDGRAWFGLQDNGSGFVDYDGTLDDNNPRAIYQTAGGDGFFVATDPFDSDIAYHEVSGATMRVTVDGGFTTSAAEPPSDGGPYRFSNPFVMDPNDALHLATAGSQVYERVVGPDTSDTDNGWIQVFDLGAIGAPGVPYDRPLLPTDPDGPYYQMSAIDIERNASYVGFCGICDILNSNIPFENGIATNVGGDLPMRGASSDGWHIASAKGLPNRFITSVAIDERDPRTVFVTLGGYSRKWAGPGTQVQDVNTNVGEGHVFKSTDAGETFVDWSGNLPDINTTWVELRGDQILVGTELGAFGSRSDGAATYAPLEDIPPGTVGTIQMQPGNPNRAIIALFGRGVWAYDFADRKPVVTYDRLSGSDRVLTAVEISQEQFRSADTVTIASSEKYADALAAVPLAAWKDGPILLSPSGGLSPAVAAEIQRLGAKEALVIGGRATLSDQIVIDLARIGVDTRRIYGTDRFATAVAIAGELPVAKTTAGLVRDPHVAYVVEGINADPNRGWPDALTIAPVAATVGAPILLVSHGTLPDVTRDALLSMGVTDVVIVGGTASVSKDVDTAIKTLGIDTTRVFGTNRFGTSAAVAVAGKEVRLTDHRLWFTRADNWADALAAGASVAVNGGTLLLTDRGDFPGSGDVVDWVTEHRESVDHVYFLGGTASISDVAAAQIRALIAERVPVPPKTKVQGIEIASYDFEDGAQGWTTETKEGGACLSCDLGVPGVPNPPRARNGWMLVPPGDNSAQAWALEPYTDDTTALLISPPIQMPKDGTLQLDWRGWDNHEEGYDFLLVQYTPDGGTTWKTIEAYDSQDPTFQDRQVKVNLFAGTYTFRFNLTSDSNTTTQGAGVDNVKFSY